MLLQPGPAPLQLIRGIMEHLPGLGLQVSQANSTHPSNLSHPLREGQGESVAGRPPAVCESPSQQPGLLLTDQVAVHAGQVAGCVPLTLYPFVAKSLQ